jgi:hypothetical protein
MKVVQGHNFHVDWHFKFEGKKVKTWSIASSSCSPECGGIQSLAADCAKSVEENTLEPL